LRLLLIRGRRMGIMMVSKIYEAILTMMHVGIRGKRKEYELGYEEGYDAGFDDGFADSGCDSEEEE